MEKFIKNYNESYSVDENGIVFSFKRGKKELKPNGKVYDMVDLCLNGKIKRYLVHRLVAETFIPNDENKPEVNHIDGNKKNNKLSNLEWATRSENQKHALQLGLRSCNGVKNSQSKLNDKIVLEILNDKRQYKFISKDYNISIPTISDIKRGHTWKHLSIK